VKKYYKILGLKEDASKD